MISCILVTLISLVFGLTPNGTNKLRLGISLGYPSFESNHLFRVTYINAIYLRIKQLNENSPLLGNDTTLEPVFLDTKLDRITTIVKGLEADEKNIVAVIGSGRSYLSTLSSLVLQNYRIPQCCGSSTDPSLSDKLQYPNFFRTIPTDNSQAAAMIGYAVASGWTKIAIIYTDESYGTGLANYLQHFARLNNVTVLARVAVNLGTSELAALPSILTLQQSDARIILYCGLSPEYMKVLKVSREVGIYGPGYVWIGPDTLGNLNTAFPLTASLYEGTLSFFPVEFGGSESESFAEYYKENHLNSTFIHNNYTYPEPGAYSYFFATCVDLLLNGFDSLLSTSESWSVADLANGQLNDQMKIPDSFQFPDLLTPSGYVRTDQNGDRFGDYRIMNFLSDGTANVVGGWVNGEIVFLKEIVYPGGLKKKPNDGINPFEVAEYANDNSPLHVLSVTAASIGFFLTLLCIVLTIIYRQRGSIKRFGFPISIGMQSVLVGMNSQFLVMVDNPTTPKCIADSIIIPILFSIYYGLLLAKNVRLYLVFNIHNQKILHTWKIYLLGLIFSLPSAIILLVFNIIDPPIPAIIQFNSSTYYWTCQRTVHQQTVTALLSTVNAIILLANLIIAFYNRNIQSKYNETKLIALSVYNVCVISVFGTIILQSKSLRFSSNYIIKTTLIFYIMCFNLVSTFYMQVYHAIISIQNETGVHTMMETDVKIKDTPGKPIQNKTMFIVNLKPMNNIFDYLKKETTMRLSRDTKDRISLYEIKRISLDTTNTMDLPIGYSWNKLHLTDFKLIERGNCQIMVILNGNSFQLTFENIQDTDYWTRYFELWTNQYRFSNLNSKKNEDQ